MLLWLLNEHHIPPGVYWRMPEGEKTVLRLLFEKLMEGRREP